MHQSIPAAHIPPGQLRGICAYCQSRGSGISLSQGYSRASDTHVVSDSKSNMEDFVGKDHEFVPDWLLFRVLDNIGDLFKGMFRRFYDFFYLFFRGGVFALFFPPHPRESATKMENSYNVRGLAGGMGAAGIEGMHKLESFFASARWVRYFSPNYTQF